MTPTQSHLYLAGLEAMKARLAARASAQRALTEQIRQIVRDEILKDRLARARERLGCVTAELEATKTRIAAKK